MEPVPAMQSGRSLIARAALWGLLVLATLVAVAAAAQAVSAVTNGIYQAAVEDGADKHGQWVAGTGASFGTPAQNDKSITYQWPASFFSRLSIKSYDTDTVYSHTEADTSALALDDYSPSTTVFGTTIETTWSVVEGADDLQVKQTIEVGSTSGTPTASNSYIRIAAEVCNGSTGTANVGIRSLWDLKINNDDGSRVYDLTSLPPPASPPYDNKEYIQDNPTALAFGTTDFAPGGALIGTFNVYGLLNDLGNPLLPEPVDAPDRFMYWPFGTSTNPSTQFAAWDPVDSPVPADGSVTDSVAIYFWGRLTPIILSPSGSPGDCFQADTYITLDLTSVTPLTVDAQGPYLGTEGTPVVLTAIPDGGMTPYSCSWSFPGASPVTATGCSAATTYLNGGAYTATVTVTDGAGQTATDTATVNMAFLLDVDAGGPYTAQAGTIFAVVPTAAGGSPPLSCYWSGPAYFGASNPGPCSSLNVMVADCPTLVTLTLIVTDSIGDTASDTADVDVTCPPASPSDGDGSASTGGATDGVDQDVAGADSDGDGTRDRDDVCPYDPEDACEPGKDLEELLETCDARCVDSDGDGVLDIFDAFPEDPERWSADQATAGEAGEGARSGPRGRSTQPLDVADSRGESPWLLALILVGLGGAVLGLFLVVFARRRDREGNPPAAR